MRPDPYTWKQGDRAQSIKYLEAFHESPGFNFSVEAASKQVYFSLYYSLYDCTTYCTTVQLHNHMHM